MSGMPGKKVAVIGGGFAGLCAMIMLKEENIEPICFEKTDKHGGTWCYREESTIGVPSIMPTTIVNHSKEMGAMSNYPPTKNHNNYMKHKEFYQYHMDHARKKDVLKYIKYNSEVTEVKRASDYDLTGRWEITIKNTLTGLQKSDIFDAVLICVGHINIPKWPHYENQENFKGEIIHSHSLKGVSKYENKNVVVVGMGCSGLDASVEISNVANQVYLSTRSGAHVMPRVGSHGYPIDYLIFRRYITKMIDILPINLVSWVMENFVVDPKFNSRLYTVSPMHHILSKDPVINDHISSKLLSGSIIQKLDIKMFTEKGVIFEGDSTVTEVDAVIMATGYTWKFPFLEKGVLVEKDDRIDLYKCMWPPNLKHPTLAFIGFILAFGPGIPLGEIQNRWAAHVISRKGKLPPKEEMMEEIRERYRMNLARYGPSEKVSIRLDYTQYMDSVAEKFGAKPNFLKIFLTDPYLFYKLIFGPSLPYQYRLQGPHSWDGARDAIMKSDERVLWPLKRTETNKIESNFIILIKKYIMIFLPFV